MSLKILTTWGCQTSKPHTLQYKGPHHIPNAKEPPAPGSPGENSSTALPYPECCTHYSPVLKQSYSYKALHGAIRFWSTDAPKHSWNLKEAWVHRQLLNPAQMPKAWKTKWGHQWGDQRLLEVDIPAQICCIKALYNSYKKFEAGRAQWKWCCGYNADVGCCTAFQC